jgi:DNA-binding IclR family transcriptional regulator
VRAAAVPLFDGSSVLGAVSSVTPSGYLTEEEFVSTRLSELRTATAGIADELQRFPTFSRSVRQG